MSRPSKIGALGRHQEWPAFATEGLANRCYPPQIQSVPFNSRFIVPPLPEEWRCAGLREQRHGQYGPARSPIIGPCPELHHPCICQGR